MTQVGSNNLANVLANQRSAPHSRVRSKSRTSGIDEPAHPQGHPPKNLLNGMIRALYPKQWVKNVLVTTAPLATDNEIMDSERLVGTLTIDILVAFAAFCMAASSTYLIDDVRDVETDHAHLTKHLHPVAAGMLPVSMAYIMTVALIVDSIAMPWFASEGPGPAIVAAVYIALQPGHCFGLKCQPVIDIAPVSSSFMLHAMADGVTINISLSQWFLLVAAFGLLFTAAGKHYTRLLLAERTDKKIRKSLQGYTTTYLRFVWTLAATAVILSYALWGFEMGRAPGASSTSTIQYEISMVPFTVAILRFAADADRGDARSPDEITLKDRPLQTLAVLWLLSIAIAVYAIPVLG